MGTHVVRMSLLVRTRQRGVTRRLQWSEHPADSNTCHKKIPALLPTGTVYAHIITIPR